MAKHTVTFKWPHTEPATVIVTGTFDQWSSSLHLSKQEDGFVGSTQVPWGEKLNIKFIVDGVWCTHESLPTETDASGNVNNVYVVPPEPEDKPAEAATNGSAKPTPALHGEPSMSQLASDLATTMAATDGTSSALDYVTSGVGAAIRSVVGVDPFHTDPIAIPTPQPGQEFSLPPGLSGEPSPTPVSPIIPVPIVPVNAAENNTVTKTAATVEGTKPEEISTHIAVGTTEPENAPNADQAPLSVEPVSVVDPAEVAPVAPEPTVPPVAEAPAEPKVEAVDTTSPPPATVEIPVPVTTAVPEPPAVTEPVVEKAPEPAPVKAEESAPVPVAAIKAEEPASASEPAAASLAAQEKPTEKKDEKPADKLSEKAAPSTPQKPPLHSFPSTESPSRFSVDGSPASKASTRKKKQSIFGRIGLKNIFSSDKEKEKEKK